MDEEGWREEFRVGFAELEARIVEIIKQSEERLKASRERCDQKLAAHRLTPVERHAFWIARIADKAFGPVEAPLSDEEYFRRRRLRAERKEAIRKRGGRAS